VAGLAVQACAGLAAVHAAGLVHRDVKPQNLLLGRDGVLKLGDFGIALGLEATRLTMAGTVLGTAGYLAPEQARGKPVTAAADIYALGAVLYELLTGESPRRASSLAELLQAETRQMPELDGRGHSEDLATAVTQCLAERPEDRPRSAAALARRLAPDAAGVTTAPLPVDPALRATEILAPPPEPVRRSWRRRLALGGALVAAAVTGLVVALVATSGGGATAGTRTGNSSKAVAPPARGSTPAQGYRNLAAWLQRNER
jgi:serine/threonine-protein kinase